jgi:hypothetical protein
MVFEVGDITHLSPTDGWKLLCRTAELDIPEATGIYQSFVGGHNTMVDILHLRLPQESNNENGHLGGDCKVRWPVGWEPICTLHASTTP